MEISDGTLNVLLTIDLLYTLSPMKIFIESFQTIVL